MASQSACRSASYSMIRSSLSFFIKGAGAGLIVFLLVGGSWQVSHFWWVMAGTSLFCGIISALLRLEFQKTIEALLDDLPWM